jgi:hypothetical protein
MIATPIARMKNTAQLMGATSLAGRMRARAILDSQSPTAPRFSGVFSVGDGRRYGVSKAFARVMLPHLSLAGIQSQSFESI